MLGIIGICFLPFAAKAEDVSAASPAGPYVTPSTDVDVQYEMDSPDGGPPVHQQMRWQAASLRQRVDPENSVVYMVTSWKDRTLTVLDTLRHTRSQMAAPGTALTMPGQIPAGSFQRLGTDLVAGQYCVIWRTTDQDGRQSDACYTDDGIMVLVMQQGRKVVRAVSVSRIPQDDAIFAIPADYKEAAPAH
ncbi:hypothetical protein GOB90_02830 [Acetobacter oeni]|nr:hypothetical protein [Acetobacter oeni]